MWVDSLGMCNNPGLGGVLDSEEQDYGAIGSLPAWDEWTMCRIRMRFDDEDQQAVAGSGVVKAAENMEIILKGHN